MQNLAQMKKLGKMKSILKMIPTWLARKVSDEKIQEAESKFASYEILLSSMTKERKNPKLLKQAYLEKQEFLLVQEKCLEFKQINQ